MVKKNDAPASEPEAECEDSEMSLDDMKAGWAEAHDALLEAQKDEETWMRRIAEHMLAKRVKGKPQKVTLGGTAYVLHATKGGELHGCGLKPLKAPTLAEA